MTGLQFTVNCRIVKIKKIIDQDHTYAKRLPEIPEAFLTAHS
jgi:hypothetical protein